MLIRNSKLWISIHFCLIPFILHFVPFRDIGFRMLTFIALFNNIVISWKYVCYYFQ